MNTRRSFLATLLAAPAALFALSRAKAAPKAPELTVTSYPLDSVVRYARDRGYTVQGMAIKVPSNRIAIPIYRGYHPPTLVSVSHLYEGDWDGQTFKLERGCSNPAYVLADLMERLHCPEDWVTMDERGHLDWQMIYNWGQHCDRLHYQPRTLVRGTDGFLLVRDTTLTAPRFTVNVSIGSASDMEQLREDLRMHCLQWQSRDPRYRTSCPVTAWPEEEGHS